MIGAHYTKSSRIRECANRVCDKFQKFVNNKLRHGCLEYGNYGILGSFKKGNS